MKRVLMTGATGFVGANLARRLLCDGHELHLLVRQNYTPWRIEAIQTDVHLYEVDFGDKGALTRVVGHIGPDWIFHLAAYGAYSWQTALHQMVHTNIIGTINLVEACLKTGFEAFVNTGSSSEYGFKDHAPSETELVEPNSHYAVTKASATLFCRYTAQSQGVHVPTLRLYTVYGPYEEPLRLIPALILCGLDGKLPPLVSSDIARDFVYVEDVNEAYLLAAAQPNQEPGAVYNVGTGIQTAMRDVVDIAKRVIGIPVEPEWGSMPSRQWDSSLWVSDNREIRRELGWQPHHTFEQGFRMVLAWFLDHPELQSFYRTHTSSRTASKSYAVDN